MLRWALNAWQRHQTRTDAARRWLWHTTMSARAAATERQAAHAWLLGGGGFTDGRANAAGEAAAARASAALARWVAALARGA